MKFLCDAERCIECNACVTACKNEHEVPWGINRRRVVTIQDGKPGERSISVACMHCSDAPCMAVCPVDCFYQTDHDLSGKNSQQDIQPYMEHLNNAYTLRILTFRLVYHLGWLQPFFYLFPMELHVRFYMLLHRRYTQYIFLHRIRISFVPFFKPSLS